MQYFLLPGNPPAVHFYELWAQEIQAHHPHAKVRVSHYPDLGPTDDSQEAMREVLEAHLTQLNRFHQDCSSPVTLVGHSLGGYFALKLLSAAPEKIQKVILVHPFLRRPSILGLVALNVAGALQGSEKFKQTFLRRRKGLEFFFSDLAHVSQEEVLRAFHLARHESQTIGRDSSPVKIDAHLRDRIKLYYNLHDTWCTPQVISELKVIVSSEACPEPHGFITSKKHRLNLFNKF